MSKEEALKYEQEQYPIIKRQLEDNHKEVLRLYEIAWKSWDRDPENHDGAPSGIMEMYEELIRNYNRNQDAPYFARIIFQEDDSDEVTDVYIGKIGYVDLKSTKLIDWRAPIADLYYNAPLGKASYETSMFYENPLIDSKKRIDGTLSLKRQIRIEDNKVLELYDFQNTVSTDEFLKPYLTESADNRLKNIVSTIQQEQNEIIRFPLNKNTIVQGVAGSGKTTVALHRLSYLMYNYKKYIKAKDFMIISPNQVFMSYISNLLIDLDADQAYSYSLENIFKEYTKIRWNVLAKHEQYEKLEERRVNSDYLRFKGSKEFIKVIDSYLEDVYKHIFCKDLKIEGIKVLGKEQMYDYFKAVRLKWLYPSFDAWVGKVVFDMKINTELTDKIDQNLKEEDVPFATRLFIMRTLQRQGLSKYLRKFMPSGLTPLKLYVDLLKHIEKYTNYKWSVTLKKETLENLNRGVISYEDMFPLIYLQYKLEDIREYDNIKHVFIDEAQDNSYFAYYILRQIFPNAYFSIFGDLAQGLYSYQSIDNWNEIADIFENSSQLPLNKSYRTSIEIMEEANKTLEKLGMTKASNVVRHGEAVERRRGVPRDVVLQEIKEMREKGYKTIAVICKDKRELARASLLLSDCNLQILDEKNSNYDELQVVLLTVQTAKGLEFDGVIIFDEDSFDDSEKLDLKQLFVAKTRALHKLYLNAVSVN